MEKKQHGERPHRLYRHFNDKDRYHIYLELVKRTPICEIASDMGVSRSSVYREIKRNGGDGRGYSWKKAQEKADVRKARSVRNNAKSEMLIWRVKEMLREEQWSPRQISGYLGVKEGVRISHTAIYTIIHSDETGELAAHCRHRLKLRRRKKSRRETRARNIRNRTSIHDRPAEVDAGDTFGHFEMDLIVDGRRNAIVTVVERSTNFLMMSKVVKKDGQSLSETVSRTVYRLLRPYVGKNLLSITTDNGSEFADHEWLAAKLRLKHPVFFTDSFASWQKGRVENANKLIRQYIPKKTDISKLSDEFITGVQYKLNRRPREKLNFNTPKEEFFKHFV